MVSLRLFSLVLTERRSDKRRQQLNTVHVLKSSQQMQMCLKQLKGLTRSNLSQVVFYLRDKPLPLETFSYGAFK